VIGRKAPDRLVRHRAETNNSKVLAELVSPRFAVAAEESKPHQTLWSAS